MVDPLSLLGGMEIMPSMLNPGRKGGVPQSVRTLPHCAADSNFLCNLDGAKTARQPRRMSGSD